MSETPFKRGIIPRKFKLPVTSKIKFAHTIYSEFARAFKDFIHFEVYNEFKGFVYADYDKGIQTVLQSLETQASGDLIDYGFPLLNYDITIDGTVKEVDSYWRSSKSTVGISKAIYEPFYKDSDIELRLIYRRMHGTIPVYIYCSSQPEQIDIQMAFIDSFRGGDRFIVTPIRSFIIVPDTFVMGDVDGKQISKNLKDEFITKGFVKAINKHAFYISANSAPVIKLTNISASNSLYGGKQMPEFVLNASFEFEIEVPQYLMAHSINYGNVDLDVSMGFEYEKNNRSILNGIFGGIKYKESNSHVTVCENGSVLGQNALIVDNVNGITEIDFDTIYPFPRDFIPIEKRLEVYLDTPLGVLTETKNGNDGYFTIDHPSENKYIIKMNDGIQFQKNDLVGVYIFKPFIASDFE